jgi:ABC-type nitrate/sulfonate/bicarbonate transport system substrate-binding protein
MTRYRISKTWNRIVFALGLALLAENIAEAQSLQRVLIAYPSRSIGSIHSFIALERGFFREEGLDAQLVQVRGTAAVAATVSGDANALEAMGTAMSAIQRGVPLRILAVNLYKPLFWLVTRPQLKTAHELNGKIMGTTTFGGVQHLTGLRMLRKLGVNPETVTVIQVGDVPTQLQALVQGSIDIALLSPPTVIRARDQYKMNLLAGALNDFVGFQNGFAVLEANVSKDPALFKKMLRARAKANRYFWENEKGTSEVLAKYVRVDLPTASESYRLSREAYTTNGIPSEKEINEVLKTDAEMLKIPEPLPSSKIFDFGLQRETNKELGVK